MKKIFFAILSLCSLVLASSCKNGDVEFADFDYQSVYFAKQTPIRTITLGEDDAFPNELDNAHMCQLQVVLGGVWSNKVDRHVKIAVDNSLVDNLKFNQIEGEKFVNTGKPVVAMPSDYYSLETTDVVIPAGKVRGVVNVKLNDAFFNDLKSAYVTYVIPVRILEAGNDTILEDKNYTLYAVEYKNPYSGIWLNTADNTSKSMLTCYDMNSVNYAHSETVTAAEFNANGEPVYKDGKLQTVSKTLDGNAILTIGADGNITFSTNSADCKIKGTGKFVKNGSKVDHSVAWGDRERDLIEVNFDVIYSYEDYDEATQKKVTREVTKNYNEKLVLISRGNHLREFTTTK